MPTIGARMQVTRHYSPAAAVEVVALDGGKRSCVVTLARYIAGFTGVLSATSRWAAATFHVKHSCFVEQPCRAIESRTTEDRWRNRQGSLCAAIGPAQIRPLALRR